MHPLLVVSAAYIVGLLTTFVLPESQLIVVRDALEVGGAAIVAIVMLVFWRYPLLQQQQGGNNDQNNYQHQGQQNPNRAKSIIFFPSRKYNLLVVLFALAVASATIHGAVIKFYVTEEIRGTCAAGTGEILDLENVTLLGYKTPPSLLESVRMRQQQRQRRSTLSAENNDEDTSRSITSNMENVTRNCTVYHDSRTLMRGIKFLWWSGLVFSGAILFLDQFLHWAVLLFDETGPMQELMRERQDMFSFMAAAVALVFSGDVLQRFATKMMAEVTSRMYGSLLADTANATTSAATAAGSSASSDSSNSDAASKIGYCRLAPLLLFCCALVSIFYSLARNPPPMSLDFVLRSKCAMFPAITTQMVTSALHRAGMYDEATRELCGDVTAVAQILLDFGLSFLPIMLAFQLAPAPILTLVVVWVMRVLLPAPRAHFTAPRSVGEWRRFVRESSLLYRTVTKTTSQQQQQQPHATSENAAAVDAAFLNFLSSNSSRSSDGASRIFRPYGASSLTLWAWDLLHRLVGKFFGEERANKIDARLVQCYLNDTSLVWTNNLTLNLSNPDDEQQQQQQQQHRASWLGRIKSSLALQWNRLVRSGVALQRELDVSFLDTLTIVNVTTMAQDDASAAAGTGGGVTHALHLHRICRILRETFVVAPGDDIFFMRDRNPIFGTPAATGGGTSGGVNNNHDSESFFWTTTIQPVRPANTTRVLVPDLIRLHTALRATEQLQHYVCGAASNDRPKKYAVSLTLLSNPNFLFTVRMLVAQWKFALLHSPVACQLFWRTHATIVGDSANSSSNSSGNNGNNQTRPPFHHMDETQHLLHADEVREWNQAFDPTTAANPRHDDALREQFLFQMTGIKILGMFATAVECVVKVRCVLPVALSKQQEWDETTTFSMPQWAANLLNVIGISDVHELTKMICAREHIGGVNCPKPVRLSSATLYERPVVSRNEGLALEARGVFCRLLPLALLAIEPDGGAGGTSTTTTSKLAASAAEALFVVTRMRRQDRIVPSSPFNVLPLVTATIRSAARDHGFELDPPFAPFASSSSSSSQSPRDKTPREAQLLRHSRAVVARVREFIAATEVTSSSASSSSSSAMSGIGSLFSELFGRKNSNISVDSISSSDKELLRDMVLEVLPGHPPPPQHLIDHVRKQNTIDHAFCFTLLLHEVFTCFEFTDAAMQVNAAPAISLVRQLTLHSSLSLVAVAEFLLRTRTADVRALVNPVAVSAVLRTATTAGNNHQSHRMQRFLNNLPELSINPDSMLRPRDVVGGNAASAAYSWQCSVVCCSTAYVLARLYEVSAGNTGDAQILLQLCSTGGVCGALESALGPQVARRLVDDSLAHAVKRPGLFIEDAVVKAKKKQKEEQQEAEKRDEAEEDDDDDDGERCCICLEPLSAPSTETTASGTSTTALETVKLPATKLVVLKQCQHKLHLKCAASFLASANSANSALCPVCRRPIKE